MLDAAVEEMERYLSIYKSTADDPESSESV
jgi:hypothetical protein